jgi:MFS transporter, PPP family, 3-phenylpropionic acid transporter
MKKFIPFSFYFLYFAAASALFPFMALYFQELGLSGAQIGILTGLGPLITLVGAPLWTGLADASHRHRLVMSAAMIGTIISVLIIPFMKTFWVLIPFVGLYALMSAPAGAFADSATMSMLGDEKALYGRVRVGGTIGWGLAAPIAGTIIAQKGPAWSFWIFAAGMAFAMLVSQGFVFEKVQTKSSVQYGIRTLLADRRWVLFLAMVFFGGIGMATVNSYLFVYMKEIGASEQLMGITLTVSTLSELPMMFFANKLLYRFKAHGLLVLSVIVIGIRLLLQAAFNIPIVVLAIQLVHGLTFPAIWVAGVSYAHENAPAGMASTAQGVFGATMMGIGAAAGGLLGGLFLQSFGGRGMYLITGCIVLIGLAILLLLERRSAPEPA